MGFFSKFLGLFSSKKKVKIIIVGLDNSGKTTIVNWLKPKKRSTEVIETAPTISYSVESFSKKNFNFTIFDMSGQGKYRDLWEKFYSDVNGIIFVLDSADKIRFVVAKNELDMLLSHKDIKDKNIPVLFYANKMDLDGAASPQEFVDMLKLESLTDRSWHIGASDARKGEGLEDGLKWLVEKLADKKK